MPEPTPLSVATIKQLYKCSWHLQVSVTNLTIGIQSWKWRKKENTVTLWYSRAESNSCVKELYTHLRFVCIYVYICIFPRSAGLMLGFVMEGDEGTL